MVGLFRAQRLFRTIGLGLFYNVLQNIFHLKKPISQPKKIAIRKDGWMAFFTGLIHLLPITASFVLIILS